MAARFWVNGTGTWSSSNTTNWAATSGGTAGASVPGTGDVVTFDGNSGTGFTVTVATGYNPSVISFTGGTASVTLDLNNQTLTAQTFNFQGTGVRTLAWGASGQIIITGSGLNVFTTQTDTNLTCSGSRNVYFTYTGGTGTRTIGTPVITTIDTNSLNYYIQGGTDSITMQGPSGITVRNLDLTGFSGTFNTNQLFAYGSVTLSSTMTLTAATTTWTFRGPSGGTQTLTTAGKTLPVGITVQAPGGTLVFADDVTMGVTTGTSGTLTLTSGTINLNNRTVSVGLFSSSNSNARVLAFGTSSTLNITGNAGTIWTSAITTNLSYTGTQVVNCTYSGSTGTRTLSVGTLTVANSVSFNFSSGTDTVIISGSCRDLNFTGFAGTLTSGVRTVSGDLTLSAGMTCTSGTQQTTFVGTGASQTFTTNGVTFDVPVSITSANPVILNGILNSPTRAMTISTGGFDAAGYAVTVGSFSSNNSNARTINISNITVTLNLASTPWNMDNSSNATMISSNSTILLANNSTSSRSFRGGNLTYGNIVIGGNTSISTTEFEGNITIETLSSTKTVAHTITFEAGTTTTMSGFTVNGTEGNVVTIKSFTNAVHNLVLTGGGNVDVSYANISYSNASPANTWYALTSNNNTDSGNNTGWIFSSAPTPSSTGNFFSLLMI